MEQRPEQTQEITAEQLSELLQVRRDKLSALVAEGKDPFAVIRFDQDTHSADIQADFDAYENKEVSIAGLKDLFNYLIGIVYLTDCCNGKCAMV